MLFPNQTMITRHYYTLEDLFNASDDYTNKFNGPLGLSLTLNTSVISFLNSLAGYTDSGETDANIDTLFFEYIYPRFYSSTIGYIDTENETEPNSQDIKKDALIWLGRVLSWLESTRYYYGKLINLYQSNEQDFMKQLTSESTTLFNDTPQDGGDFTKDTHLTNASKTKSSSDVATPIARLKEIRDNIEDFYKTWSDEFRKFIILTEV